MRELSVRPAGAGDRAVVERLWPMFRHDMSEFQGQLPDRDGRFRDERLRAAFGGAGWEAFLMTSGELPVGFALVRGADGPVRVMNSFFVVRAARRGGTGLRAALEVMARRPGRWEVAFQDNNPVAVRFWRRVAAEAAGADWSQERRPVPGRPDLPPDVWISLRVPGTGGRTGE